MARIPLILTALFFFFAFSDARNSLDLPGIDVYNLDLSNFLPENDKEPPAKQESEPIMLAKLDPQASEKTSLELQAHEKAGEESVETNSKTVKADPLERPLTILRFQPINRHFPVNRPFTLRFPRRGCHHGVMKPRGHGREVPYGNDMLIAGDLRENAEQWIRFDHHHHHHFHHHHDRDHKTFEKQSLRKLSRHEDEDEEEKPEHEEGGLLKRFREFIDDLF